MSTAENNTFTNISNPNSISEFGAASNGNSAHKNEAVKYQIYQNLEQIEELESSNYFQSEVRTLQDEGNKGISNRLINLNIIQQDSPGIKTKYANSQQSTQVPRGSGTSMSHSSQTYSNSSQSNSPTRSRNSISSNISPRLRDKKKTAQEIRNIIRMQTESYFSSFISEDLNEILKQGESMSTVMAHFEFSSNDQILDLVRDIYNSVLNKKTKLQFIVLPEHRDIVMQFIQQAYLLLDRGIQQLLKTQKKLINMTDSNTSQLVRKPNSELSLHALSVLVETYQVIQYFQMLNTTYSYVPQNKWWTKNQNEKDLSSFYKKFVRLSQQLNAEFQDGYSLTPGIPKRARKEKKHTTAATFSYNIDVQRKYSNQNEEDEAEKEKGEREEEEQHSQTNKENQEMPSYYKPASQERNQGSSQFEKQKQSSPYKKNPTNLLPLVSHQISLDISNGEIVEQDENEEEKQYCSRGFHSSYHNENVDNLDDSDIPCKVRVNHHQDYNITKKTVYNASFRN